MLELMGRICEEGAETPSTGTPRTAAAIAAASNLAPPSGSGKGHERLSRSGVRGAVHYALSWAPRGQDKEFIFEARTRWPAISSPMTFAG
jgi:hypothetical protein